MLKTYLLGLFITILMSLSNVHAQQKEFGDVSKEILAMEVYEKDSTADALILFDVAEVYVNEELEVNFKRHVRIKILTDNGLEAGDIALDYRDDDPRQDIRKIKAETYNLSENGKIEKTKLGRRDKFTNKVSDSWEEIKFTLPALKKGSVFEYSYEMNSESPFDIYDWYFQREYPVAWSEYKVSLPSWFRYLTHTRGYHPFFVNDQSLYSDMATFSNGERFDYTGIDYHYVMKDIPAITAEPYMKARSDYQAQVRFQLSSYQFPNSLRTDVMTSWPMLVKRVYESDNYGDKIKSYSLLKDEAMSVVSESDSALEKMILLYQFIGEKMEWDENHGLYVDKDLDDIYEEGTGNGTEINLIYMQMLREAGLNADPVIISTRSNGEIIDIYPIDDQFNHTITRVKIDGKQYLLDAKNERRPYNLLPSSNLNGKGLVIKSDYDDLEWVELKNDVNNRLVNYMNIVITEDGVLEGTMESKNLGYFGYLYRDAFFDEDDITKAVKEYVFDEMEDIEVDSALVRKDERSGEFSYFVQFQKPLDKGQDVMYLNPMLVEAIKKNPFTKEKRTYPVDYEFEFNKTVTMNIQIPEGWTISELPESKVYKLKNESGEYFRLLRASGNTLVVRYNFKLNKTRFMPNQYDEVKFLYENVAQDNSEAIVLKKVEE
jgi:hypothetical protein